MKKTGIFYSNGIKSLREITGQIAQRLNIKPADIHNVSSLTPEEINRYDLLLLGIPTSSGGQLPADWEKAIRTLQTMNLGSKTIALFGCGSSHSCGHSFCDTLQRLYNELGSTGATFVKTGPEAECVISQPEVVNQDKLVGLAIDEMNEGPVTDKKVEQWVDILNNNRNNQL